MIKPKPTPETDAAEKDMSGNGITVHTKFVTADFARKLERERDEAARNTEKAKAYKKVMKDENARLRQWKESTMPCSVSWIPLHDALITSPCLVTDGINVEKARWKPRNREWVFPHAKLRLTPTHWMPLPSPPNSEISSSIPSAASTCSTTPSASVSSRAEE